jgi:hypothetical protein
MDPTACWERMLDAFEAREFDEAAAAAEDLLEWMRRGGFAPLQISNRTMPREFDLLAATAVCRAVLESWENDPASQLAES